MILFRSLFPIALVLVATGAAGCKEDPPPAKPEPVASSTAPSKGKLNLRSPLGPMAKVDPQSMKEYRTDVCYFGPLTLKQARDAYLTSLGKDEPSEKKIPSFGGGPVPAAAPGGPPGAPPGGPAPGAPPGGPDPHKEPGPSKGPPGAGKDPTAKGLPGMPKPDERRPFNVATRAPHERNARSCTVAVGLKEPAMPELDPVVAEYAPFAVDLAKTIAAASNYYQREEYKKDNFAKGKEMHKQLLAGFEKLDAQSEKLGLAVEAWHKAHPADLASAEEGQKLAIAALEDARNIVLGLLGKKIDTAAHKEAVTKLSASVEGLKTFGTGHQADPWSKIMVTSFEAFLKALKDAEPKVTEKGISDPEAFLPVVTTFTSLIEAKHRALTRSLIAKGQTQPRQISPTKPAAPHEDKPAEQEKPDQE